MANEISIQAVLTQQRFSPVIQGVAAKDVTATNSKGAYNVQALTAIANAPGHLANAGVNA